MCVGGGEALCLEDVKKVVRLSSPSRRLWSTIAFPRRMRHTTIEKVEEA